MWFTKAHSQINRAIRFCPLPSHFTETYEVLILLHALPHQIIELTLQMLFYTEPKHLLTCQHSGMWKWESKGNKVLGLSMSSRESELLLKPESVENHIFWKAVQKVSCKGQSSWEPCRLQHLRKNQGLTLNIPLPGSRTFENSILDIHHLFGTEKRSIK